MLKLLITGAIIYFIYRFYIAPPSIEQQGQGPTIRNKDQSSGKRDNEDDYIDYEEVD